MTSRCECVVKRTGQVCAKPTTGFSFQQGTPVCGLHTGRPRRRPHNNNQQPIKKEDPPPPPPPHSLQEQPHVLVPFIKRRNPPKKKTLKQTTMVSFVKRRNPPKNSVSTQTGLVDRFPYFKSVLSWIVVLTTLMLLNPPTETSCWTQKMFV